MDFKDTYGVLQIMATPQPEEIDDPLDRPVSYYTGEIIKRLKEIFKSLWTGLVSGSKTTTLLTAIKP